MNKLQTFTRPDTIEDLKETDLVQLARRLLDATVVSTDALNGGQEINEQRLKELKLVLGFLNASNSVIKTKLQVFKMTGLPEKIAEVKKSAESL